jgi:hypothetical protein
MSPLHILTIDDQVYDVTEWLQRHPGGSVISAGVGIDATALFYAHHLGDKALARAKAALAALPRVRGGKAHSECKHFVGPHYGELAAEAKAVLSRSDTAALDWAVCVLGCCALACALVASRLYASLVATLALPLLSRVSDGYQHADGHGQPFRVPLWLRRHENGWPWQLQKLTPPLRRLCTAFHYTFGQSPYGHGGHYYYFPVRCSLP